jgi:hypothetical protein
VDAGAAEEAVLVDELAPALVEVGVLAGVVAWSELSAERAGMRPPIWLSSSDQGNRVAAS